MGALAEVLLSSETSSSLCTSSSSSPEPYICRARPSSSSFSLISSAIVRSMMVRALFRLADRSASGTLLNMPFSPEFFRPFGVENIASPFTAFFGVDKFSASLGLFLLPLGRPRPRFEGVSGSLPESSSSSSFATSADPASESSSVKSLIRLDKRSLPFGLVRRFLVGVDCSMFSALSVTAVRHCSCFRL